MSDFAVVSGPPGMNHDETTEEFGPTGSDLRSDAPPARACRSCSTISETDEANCPECGAAFARRRLRDVVPASTLVVALIALPLIAGAFFIGQSTRKSDQQVARQTAATLTAQRKVLSDRAKVKTAKLLDRQETKLRKVFNKRAKKRAEKAYKNGSAAGYSSGSSDGYASGHDDGAADGLNAGIDLGACLADDYWC